MTALIQCYIRECFDIVYNEDLISYKQEYKILALDLTQTLMGINTNTMQST